jgi:CubicO group peptidase (beta-lactamase class C family)
MGHPSELPRVPRSGPLARVSRLIAVLGIAGTAVIPWRCTGTTAGNDDGSLAQRTDALLQPLVAAHEFSGAVVLARGDSVLYASGFGMANHQAGVPFTPDTPSDAASIAKTFTAAALWLLVHEGRVALDTPVVRYVAEYPHPTTTVRQLIGHSNGLPDSYEFFDPHFAPGEVRSTEGLLRVVARERPAPSFPPGTRFEYSSLGYDVAALVVERVTGRRFADVLAERFFSPLGMTASFARPARFADWPGVRTMGYRWADSTWTVFDVFDGEAFVGGSNLYHSANDLSRWARAFALGRALPAEVMAKGQAWTTIDGQEAPLTALNWYCDAPRERCYYTGDLNAFFSFAYWDRVRGESVVYVSNSALPMWRRAELARALVEVLAGRDAVLEDPSAATAFVRFSDSTRARVAGEYEVPGLGALHLRQAGERLVLQRGEGLEFAVFPVSAEVFYVPGTDWWLSFSGGVPPRVVRVRSVFAEWEGQRK